MKKKIKLLLSSFVSLSAIVTIPIVVVSCSSKENLIPYSNLDFASTGLWNIQNLAPSLSISTKADITLNKLINAHPNTYQELLQLININIISQPNQNIDINAKAKVLYQYYSSNNTIHIYLGIYGAIVGTIENSNIKWSFTKIDKNGFVQNGKELANFISGLPSEIDSEDVLLSINGANSSNTQDQLVNNINQYIWLSKNDINIGALVGTFNVSSTDKNSFWTWVYKPNQKKVSLKSDINITNTGIDSSIKTLGVLSDILNLPILYQYSLSTNTKVDISAIKRRFILELGIPQIFLRQTITIVPNNGLFNYIIDCNSNNGTWTYSFKIPLAKSIETKASVNLSSKGFWNSKNPVPTLNVSTIKDATIPVTGIPSNITTYEELNKYLIIDIKDTNGISTKLPSATSVSNIEFTNGTDNTEAKISFSLGIYGQVEGVAETKGPVAVSTIYNWSVKSVGILTTIDQLSHYLDNLPSRATVATSIVIDPINEPVYNMTINQKINQYIWLFDKDKKLIGLIKGIYSNDNWTWEYSSTEKEISATNLVNSTGIPSAITKIKELTKYLNMPIINHYNLLKNSIVTINPFTSVLPKTEQKLKDDPLADAPATINNQQTITINQDNIIIKITGIYTNGVWTYSYKIENNS